MPDSSVVSTIARLRAEQALVRANVAAGANITGGSRIIAERIARCAS